MLITKYFENINPYTLAFTVGGSELERDYQQYSYNHLLLFRRIALIFGAAVYMIFGTMEIYTQADPWESVWVIRYLLCSPLFFIMFAATFISRFDLRHNELLSLLMLLVSLSLLAMMQYVVEDVRVYYLFGMLLAIFYACSVPRIKFLHNVGIALISVTAYTIMEIKTDMAIGIYAIPSYYFLIFSPIVSLFAAYWLEYYDRKTFYYSVEMERKNRLIAEQAAEARSLHDLAEKKVTEADQAKQMAEKGHARVRSIIETTIDAVIIIDSQGIIREFNKSAQKIFGYTQKEAVDSPVTLLMSDELALRHEEGFTAYLKGEPPRFIGSTMESVAQRKDGSSFPMEMSVSKFVFDGERTFTGIIRDITSRKRAEEKIFMLATTDPLTGVGNRNEFNKQLEESIKSSRRTGHHLMLALIDLDHFKPVNDKYGHQAGDAVLKEISDRIMKICRETDVVARLGGDEFAIIFTNVEHVKNIATPAKRLVSSISAPINFNDHQLSVGASIGIARYPDHGETPEELIKSADRALYKIKASGRGAWAIFENGQNNQSDTTN